MPGEPQFKKGDGPDALPQGEATRLNQALEDTSPPEGVDLSGAMMAEKDDQPSGDDDEFLFGATERPGESVMAGMNQVSGKRPIPQEVFQYLPALLELARDPDAPPQVHAMIAQLNYHLQND